MPWTLRLEVTFQHAHKTRWVTVSLGWLPLRLPDTQLDLWALVAYAPDFRRQIILLTNIPIDNAQVAEQVHTRWRFRRRIEHACRFHQEQGPDVKDMRVQTAEWMRRVFVLVLLAALFVYYIDQTWPPQAVFWLRRSGWQALPEHRCRRPLRPAHRHQCGLAGPYLHPIRPSSSYSQAQGDLQVITTNFGA